MGTATTVRSRGALPRRTSLLSTSPLWSLKGAAVDLPLTARRSACSIVPNGRGRPVLVGQSSKRDEAGAKWTRRARGSAEERGSADEEGQEKRAWPLHIVCRARRSFVPELHAASIVLPLQQRLSRSYPSTDQILVLRVTTPLRPVDRHSSLSICAGYCDLQGDGSPPQALPSGSALTGSRQNHPRVRPGRRDPFHGTVLRSKEPWGEGSVRNEIEDPESPKAVLGSDVHGIRDRLASCR